MNKLVRVMDSKFTCNIHENVAVVTNRKRFLTDSAQQNAVSKTI